jgi:hypothetical protein
MEKRMEKRSAVILTADFKDQMFPEQCSPNEMILTVFKTN